MTAGDAIATLLSNEWQPQVPGRDNIPDTVASPEKGTGVLIVQNNQNLRERTNTHDIVHVQHVDKAIQDKGSNSEKVVDTVQIDVVLSDRDTDGDSVRESAVDRLVGTRNQGNEGPSLGGIAGEIKRILNGIRKGFKEWDVSSHSVDQLQLLNTNARATFTLELEIIERNVEQPL